MENLGTGLGRRRIIDRAKTRVKRNHSEKRKEEQDDRPGEIGNEEKVQIKGCERKRVRNRPDRIVAVQIVARSPALGESHAIRGGRAEEEDVIADHHQTILVTREEKAEVAVETDVLVRGEEATTNHQNQEAGVEVEGLNKGDTKS